MDIFYDLCCSSECRMLLLDVKKNQERFVHGYVVSKETIKLRSVDGRDRICQNYKLGWYYQWLCLKKKAKKGSIRAKHVLFLINSKIVSTRIN